MTEVHAQGAEDALDHLLGVGREQDGRAGIGPECVQFALGEELRDRRAHLARFVDDEVCEAFCAPLLRELLEAPELGTGERTRCDEVAHPRRAGEHTEGRIARDLRRVLDLEPEADIRLVVAVPEHRVRIREPRKWARGRRPPDRLERCHHDSLEHLEHVLARRERELQVELAKLELPVGAEILVAPAGRDLVVAVDAADHEQLLEQLRRLREREEAPGLQAHRQEEIARALGRSQRHARRPHVDEPLLLHRRSDRADDVRRQAEVPLHPLPAQIEVAVAEPQRLLHPIVVELERERLRPRHDLEHVELNLDLAGRDVRVDSVGRAAHHLAFGAQDELGAHVVRDRRGGCGALGVGDELNGPGVVPEVDEDEPAVVAAACSPAGDGDAPARVLATQVAAVEVTPARHPAILSTRPSSGVAQSSFPCSRTVARAPSTMTVQPAPRRLACVICPFSERAA